VALVERCLLASTNEGDLVLDPFLGNGTTAVVSLRLKRGCVGVELDIVHVEIAGYRADREIIEIWLRHFRVRVEITVCGRDGVSLSQTDLFRAHSPRPETPDARPQIDLAIFPDSINGSRRMAGVPEIQTERIFHECKFVFLSCAQVERGAVVHTTIDVSLQEAWLGCVFAPWRLCDSNLSLSPDSYCLGHNCCVRGKFGIQHLFERVHFVADIRSFKGREAGVRIRRVCQSRTRDIPPVWPRPGRDDRCQNKPAKSGRVFETQGTVLWIFLPKPVGFAGSGPGVG
jgi:hypothetical protein